MRLDSALGLKAELMSEGLARMLPTRSMLPRAAARATRVSARTVTHRDLPLAVGIQGRGGKYRLALRVQRVLPGLDAVVEHIRRRARGEVEVRMVGRVVKQNVWHRSRNRPLLIGGSIGHFGITAGTLGAFVHRAGKPDEDFLLSNNHVLANENLAKRGDDLLQPGPLDGGRRNRDRVGTLDHFVRLKQRNNKVDAALGTLVEDIEYYVDWLEGLGGINGVRSDMLDEGETVYKIGRTTGLTRGRVSAIEVDGLEVGYDTGSKLFDGQVEIAPGSDEPFSLGGDSGSLIVDAQRRVVALLFAGNDVDATYANPVGAVLDALKIELTL
jgi:hypothetical protein